MGLGPWAVTDDERLLGVGGVSPREGWWNLGFRLAPAAWGSGLGTHVAREAVSAGRVTRPTWPVVARSLETNPASGRVSERAGLRLVWQGRLEGLSGPAAGLCRLVHADRDLSEDRLARIRALG